LGFAVKNHPSQDCRYYVRHSTDEGRTWGEPVLAIPEPGYFVVNNDRLRQTREGRVLLPAAKATDARYHCVSTCFTSDDTARSGRSQTWQRRAPYLDLPESPVGLQEPGIVQCGDGTLWMYMRTDRGRIYACRSSDLGDSWSDPQPTSLIAPVSPASARRLPGSDEILMVYNDRRGVPYSPERGAASPRGNTFHHRTPLTAAVSSDGGRTWHSHQEVESDRSRSYCYTSIAFHGENTLLTYYVGRAGGPNLLALKLCIVPTAAWSSAHPEGL
jgi:hypothetical protein